MEKERKDTMPTLLEQYGVNRCRLSGATWNYPHICLGLRLPCKNLVKVLSEQFPPHGLVLVGFVLAGFIESALQRPVIQNRDTLKLLRWPLCRVQNIEAQVG